MNIPHVSGVAIFIASLLFSFFIYSSLYEWLLHRFVMHKPIKFFKWTILDYPFEAHARIHHGTFKANETYHVQRKIDEHLIPMAWWNGPMLISASLIPFIVICCFVGHWFSINAGIGIGCAAYYIAYEWFHWCMHKPLPERRRLVEKNPIFRLLNGHHILHHRYMGKNFNVVLPLYDFLFGTLMTRSPVHFKQVRGRSVPDVQPLSVKK